MYINYNKIHGLHDIVNQIQSLHDFIDRVIGGLSPTNHDGGLTSGTIGDPMFELVNDERNALIHQPVQVRFGTCHFRHHANLQPEKRLSTLVQPIATKIIIFPYR